MKHEAENVSARSPDWNEKWHVLLESVNKIQKDEGCVEKERKTEIEGEAGCEGEEEEKWGHMEKDMMKMRKVK